MSVERRHVRRECFNPDIALPYELRSLDFESAMQDVYDFFCDVNQHLAGKGLGRLEDTVRGAILCGSAFSCTRSTARPSRSRPAVP